MNPTSQLPHHLRPGERLGEEDHVGVKVGDLADQPLPERQRLGVGIVDAEDYAARSGTAPASRGKWIDSAPR
jgi:hypothetical protein